MREIKFKIWDKTNRKWRDSRDFAIMLDGTNEVLEYTGLCDSAWEDVDEWEYEIVQYTGLKDKNEKEIYEGDVVRYEYEKGVAVIKFGEGYQGEPADGMYPYWGWYLDGYLDSYAFCGDEVEILGNVHENPNLMEEK